MRHRVQPTRYRHWMYWGVSMGLDPNTRGIQVERFTKQYLADAGCWQWAFAVDLTPADLTIMLFRVALAIRWRKEGL